MILMSEKMTSQTITDEFIYTFLFKAMKETHEQHKTKKDIDELITGPTSITLSPELFQYTHKC